ncbi:MAG TPA: hypothetical protein VLT84_09390 [Acidobacteriota bacterium]|nr:hypothetical protein [Acidobacteriota bacterium]
MTWFRASALAAWAAALLLVLSVPAPAPADEKAPAPEETRAEVPALDDYHDVIRVLWHDAWPAKDVKALRALLSQVKEGAKAVAESKLPGILRDKQAAWDEGVKALDARVADYAAASEGSDDSKLLDAAEKLHAQYEALVRVVRPALREFDPFHVVLYQLYHYDLPSDDLAAMRKTIDRMKEPMAALDAAKVPPRLAKMEKEFVSARKELSKAVAALAKEAQTDDLARVKAAVEEVHDRYQMATAVCD